MPPPPLSLRKSFVAAYEKLADEDKAAVAERLTQLPLAFGHPHRHVGLGLRKLRHPVYEFRASRALRVVFLFEGGEIVVVLVGNHDDVRRYLRGRI